MFVTCSEEEEEDEELSKSRFRLGKDTAKAQGCHNHLKSIDDGSQDNLSKGQWGKFLLKQNEELFCLDFIFRKLSQCQRLVIFNFRYFLPNPGGIVGDLRYLPGNNHHSLWTKGDKAKNLLRNRIYLLLMRIIRCDGDPWAFLFFFVRPLSITSSPLFTVLCYFRTYWYQEQWIYGNDCACADDGRRPAEVIPLCKTFWKYYFIGHCPTLFTGCSSHPPPPYNLLQPVLESIISSII